MDEQTKRVYTEHVIKCSDSINELFEEIKKEKEELIMIIKTYAQHLNYCSYIMGCRCGLKEYSDKYNLGLKVRYKDGKK